jgi:hypothetical protein
MNATKVLGLAAVGAFLTIAAPAQQAQAVSLSNPGAAAAVQSDTKQATTEVRWHHHYHHRWHRHYHHRWHRWHGWHRHHRHW